MVGSQMKDGDSQSHLNTNSQNRKRLVINKANSATPAFNLSDFITEADGSVLLDVDITNDADGESDLFSQNVNESPLSSQRVLRSSQISNSSQPSEDDPTKESGKKDEITKFFLGLVADYPMLYDTANYHYSDRRRRLISWKKIQEALTDRYTQHSLEDATLGDCSPDSLKSKLESLKGSYRQNVNKLPKSGSAGHLRKRRYKYAAEIEAILKRKTKSGIKRLSTTKKPTTQGSKQKSNKTKDGTGSKEASTSKTSSKAQKPTASKSVPSEGPGVLQPTPVNSSLQVQEEGAINEPENNSSQVQGALNDNDISLLEEDHGQLLEEDHCQTGPVYVGGSKKRKGKSAPQSKTQQIEEAKRAEQKEALRNAQLRSYELIAKTLQPLNSTKFSECQAHGISIAHQLNKLPRDRILPLVIGFQTQIQETIDTIGYLGQ